MKKEKMPKFGNKNALFPYFWGSIFKSYIRIHITKSNLFECFLGKIFEKVLSYLKSTPSNSSNSKISWKLRKCLNLRPKMLYLCIFGLYFKSTPSSFLNLRISWKKKKCLLLGAKMFYFGIFGIEFSKALFVFGISTLKFAKFQNFAKEKNYLNLSKKMPYFGNFGPEFWKAILLFAISTSCQLTKFRKKAKLPKF